MLRSEKVAAVAEMKELLANSGSIFVTDYQGLNVAQMTQLRKELRENNVRFVIAKNTLVRLAANDAGVGEIAEHLSGPTAIAFTNEDPAAAARILHESFKKHELPRMKVFRVEEHLFGSEDIGRLADLPPRDQLLSMVVAAVESPFSALVGTLDGFFRELVGVIDALADKRQGEA